MQHSSVRTFDSMRKLETAHARTSTHHDTIGKEKETEAGEGKNMNLCVLIRNFHTALLLWGKNYKNTVCKIKCYLLYKTRRNKAPIFANKYRKNKQETGNRIGENIYIVGIVPAVCKGLP